MPDEKMMSFSEHLGELRKRLLWMVYALLAAVMVAYYVSDTLFVILAQPLIRAWSEAGLGTPKLHFANPIEPFFTYMKISLIGGIFLSSPFIFYQFWKFIAPGL